MAKALRTVGRIAGAVAAVATVVAGVAMGNPAVVAAGLKIAGIAAAVSAAATIGAQLLTKPPPARGSITRIIVDPNAPTPYVMGEGLVGPVLRHDVAYGPTLKKVPNPYRFMATVFSLGPVQSISPRINFGTIPSWYNGFLFTDTQLGATPEADALVPQWAGAPGWSTNHRLSGLAAIGWSFLFDRDGERFANGIDPIAAYGQWVKVYDPRKDSTFPGGSGAHRLGNESTYEWSENPALHAGMYAYGRFQNGKRVFGIGLPADGIDWDVVAAWANVCDANEWKIFGRIFEPGDRWANLKDICFAGGAEPIPGGVLSFKYAAPKVALDTITVDDLVTDDEMSVVTMQSYRNRLNTIIPQFISPDHNWELIDAGPVVNSTFLSEDGEEKRDVWPFNFVKNATQAAQLAAYRLFETREISPITVVCKPRLRHYRPGECLHIDHPRLGLNHDVIILSRSIDPVTMKVTFELMTETPGKHDFCLGRTGVAPPTPAITQTSEERDALAAARQRPRALDVEFEDGGILEDLQPAEPGGTRNVARGTYDAGTTYVRGDEVLFSGSSYRLIVASSTGNAPPDVARWALIANAGSGPPGADGLPGISVLVSNEAHVVATAADGSGGDYSAAGGQMRLLRGDTVLTPTFSIAAQTPASPSWISINSSTGAYTVSDPGVDLATATIRANWAGVNYDRTYTLAKSKQGVTGPRLALVADNQAFTFTDGAANPGSQTITLTALLNNLSGTATFTTTPSVPLGGTGNTRTLSVANFGSNRQVTVEATLGGITDRITVVRLERDVAAPANVNRVSFSRFEGGAGWVIPGSTFASINPLAPLVFQNRTFILTEAVASAAGQFGSIAGSPRFPVIPGERLSVSARLQAFALSGAAPANWSLSIQYEQAGAPLPATIIAAGTGNSPPFDGTRYEGFSDVPAGADSAYLLLIVSSSGAGTLRLALLEPMVASAAQRQTAHPPYAPGPVVIEPIDAGGPLFVGQLPAPRVEYDGGGTVEDFKPAEPGADVTATGQRTIEAQFPVIEVKEGEAGNSGNRTISHTAFRGTATLTGGTWSLVTFGWGAGGAASINASTGVLTISGVIASGAYAVRYTHTDGLQTDRAVNVTYVPSPIAAATSARTARATSTNGTDNSNDWQTILSLTVNNVPGGLVEFGSLDLLTGVSRLSVTSATGTADYEARLTMDGTTLTSVLSQPVVVGGVLQFSEWAQLFAGSYPVTIGNRTFAIQMRRTSGTGRILATNTALKPTIIAT